MGAMLWGTGIFLCLWCACLILTTSSTVPQSTLLTLGAEPLQMVVEPNQYMKFMIDIANDYCAKTEVSARQLCMMTPQARVTVKNCRGETWLLVNPTKPWEPTIGNVEFVSQHGNNTNYIEVSEFQVVQLQTHLAVYNPATNYPRGSTFQIWAENLLDYS